MEIHTERPRFSKVHIWKKYREYVSSAKQRDIKFELDYYTFHNKIEQPCYVCGFYDKNKLNGLDRVNNDLHYHGLNVAACCWTCNRAKGNMQLEEFKEWNLRFKQNIKSVLKKERNSKALESGIQTEADLPENKFRQSIKLQGLFDRSPHKLDFGHHYRLIKFPELS